MERFWQIAGGFQGFAPGHVSKQCMMSYDVIGQNIFGVC
jgi:hypothetical protein